MKGHFLSKPYLDLQRRAFPGKRELKIQTNNSNELTRLVRHSRGTSERVEHNSNSTNYSPNIGALASGGHEQSNAKFDSRECVA